VLQRIIKIYPDSAIAVMATKRLASLDLRDVDVSEQAL
ncbi:MAG: hypothetical protein JWN25_1882, partial [Verrucomicrobiales bacterium]|nr:hypothetical protein [Verrucomicrobiales bacterium]